jgi:single-strand DNA-binding protein
MNKVFMIGRLVKDPEVRSTQTGKKVASFSIALNEGKGPQGNDLVSYFNLSAWEKTAEIVEKYAQKGTKVAVVGRLQNRSWDKPDGTKGYATDIVVSELELLSARGEQTSSGDESMSGAVPPSTRSPQAYTPAPSDTGARAAKKKESDNALPEIDVESMNVQMPF